MHSPDQNQREVARKFLDFSTQSVLNKTIPESPISAQKPKAKDQAKTTMAMTTKETRNKEPAHKISWEAIVLGVLVCQVCFGLAGTYAFHSIGIENRQFFQDGIMESTELERLSEQLKNFEARLNVSIRVLDRLTKETEKISFELMALQTETCSNAMIAEIKKVFKEKAGSTLESLF